MDVQQLREQRRSLLQQGRAILDAAKKQKRGLSSVEQTEYDGLLARANLLRGDIDRFQRRESAPPNGGLVEQHDDEIEEARSIQPGRSFSMRPQQRAETPKEKRHREAFVSYLRLGINNMPPEQRAVLQEYRDMGTGGQGAFPSATTGFFVPVGFVYDIISALKYFGPLLDSDVVNVMETATGQVLPYPTSDDVSVVGELIGEGQQVSDQDVSLGQILLGAYKFSSRVVKVSIELLQDSAFNLEDFLIRTFALRIGRALVSYFTTGLGSGSSQPLGILTSTLANGNLVAAVGSSSNTGNADGTNTIGTDDLTNLIHAIDPLYRPGGSFMMNDATLKAILKVKDKFGRPILDPTMQAAAPNTFLGYPLRINNYMPSLQTQASSPPVTVNSVIFGDLKRFLVRRVREMSVLVLRERWADYGQTGFIAYARYDSSPMYAGAGTHFPFSLLTNSF